MAGNLPPGVVQLNGRAPAQPVPHVPHVPPVHPMSQPPQGFSPFPPDLPPSMPPAMPPAGRPHGPAPPPPVQAIPRDLRPTQPAVVSDRKDRLGEEDAFELLTSYLVILLEKEERLHGFGERGSFIKSGWERPRSREQSGISKLEAARKILCLDRDGKPVLEKKQRQSSVIQHQLERQLDKLNNAESDPRYHYQLAQFDVHLREIEEPRIVSLSKHRKDKRYRPSKMPRKPKFERSAITLYFRRCPRPECNAKIMLEELEREKQRAQRMNQPPPVQPAPFPLPHIQNPNLQHMPPQSQQTHAPVKMPPPVQPVAQPTVNPAAPKNPAARGNPPAQNGHKPVVQNNQSKPVKPDSGAKPAGKPDIQIKQESKEKGEKQAGPIPAKLPNNPNNKEKPAAIVIPNSKRGTKQYFGSPRSSRYSVLSDGSGSTFESEFLPTPQPSIGSSPRRNKRYWTGIQRPEDRLRHFTVDSMRHDPDDERVYVLESSDDEPMYVLGGSRGRSPSPIRSFRPNLEFSRKARPRRQGYYSQSQEDYLYDKEASRPRVMPRVVQRRMSVRHVNPRHRLSTSDIERTGDHLERLRLDENARLGRKVHWSDGPRSEFDGLEQHIRNRRLSRIQCEDEHLENEREGRRRMMSPRVQY